MTQPKYRTTNDPDLKDEVHRTLEEIDAFVRQKNYNVTTASAALMMLAAIGSSQLPDTTDHLVNEFRRILMCLRNGEEFEGTA